MSRRMYDLATVVPNGSAARNHPRRPCYPAFEVAAPGEESALTQVRASSSFVSVKNSTSALVNNG